MKKNKLQEQADEFLSKYDNPEVKEKIIGEYNVGNERVIDHTKRNWLVSLSIVFIAIIATVGLYFLTKPSEKVYLLENQTSEKITVNELENDFLNIEFQHKLIADITKFGDIKYNETLYYRLSFGEIDTGELLEVILVPNRGYEYEFIHEPYTASLDSYKMDYIEKFIEEDELYNFNCKGEFTVKNIKVYVRYEGLSLEPQSNFINFLQQCISIKEIQASN